MKTKILLIFQLALVKIVFLVWQSLAQENKTQVLQSNVLLREIRVCSVELNLEWRLLLPFISHSDFFFHWLLPSISIACAPSNGALNQQSCVPSSSLQQMVRATWPHFHHQWAAYNGARLLAAVDAWWWLPFSCREWCSLTIKQHSWYWAHVNNFIQKMVGGFNQCDLLAAKLSVKMAPWPDALANWAHFPPGWLIPVKGPTFPLMSKGFAPSLTSCLSILITMKVIVL